MYLCTLLERLIEYGSFFHNPSKFDPSLYLGPSAEPDLSASSNLLGNLMKTNFRNYILNKNLGTTDKQFTFLEIPARGNAASEIRELSELNKMRIKMVKSKILEQHRVKRKTSKYCFSKQYNGFWDMNDLTDLHPRTHYALPIERRSMKNKAGFSKKHEVKLKTLHSHDINVELIRDLNHLLAGTRIEVHVDHVRDVATAKRRQQKKCAWLFNLLFFGVQGYDKEHVDIAAMFVYRRIFNVSWRKGGRFYAKGISLPRELRSSLKLNGNPTVELDYGSMHVRLAAREAGYTGSINGVYERVQSVLELSTRKEAKTLWNTLLNSSEEHLPQFEETLEKLDQYSDLTWFKPFLCSGKGIEYQFLESQVAQAVLTVFVNEGIPIIPVHDSFLVEEQHEDLLRRTMKESFIKLYGEEYVPMVSPEPLSERLKAC